MENKFVLDPYFGETIDPDSLINYIYTPLFLKTKIDVLYFDILNWEKYLSTLNTEAPELQLQVKVYPNPTTETIFITHPTEQFFEVRITDVSGKQILQTAHQKQQPLNVQTLTAGELSHTILGRIWML